MIAMNPDLAQERGRATFDPEQVTNLLYRGPENVRKRRYLRECYVDLNDQNGRQDERRPK